VIVIGLTGGIGSGKSTVCRRLAERGAVIIDADEIAREAVEPGRPAYAKVVERFGAKVVGSDGRLDRQAIAEIVFRDPEALADLNSIVHPEVATEVGARLASESGGDRVVVLDIPLLFEAGSPDKYPFAGLIVVDAPADIALQRLMDDRHMDRSDVEARMANQVSREERVAKADFVIMNIGTLDELDEMVTRAWAWIEGLRPG